MRIFNFGNDKVKAPTYWSADTIALQQKLETQVSDQTFNKLLILVKRAFDQVEQIETIGDRDIYVLTKFNDDSEAVGIHFSVSQHQYDECLLTPYQVSIAFKAAKEVLDENIEMYDFNLENTI